jgi:hypothetical protein
MVYKDDKYNDAKFQHLREADPKAKNRDYFRKNAEAIYSAYLRGRTGLTYSDAYEYPTLRMFGDGLQSEERYKNYFAKEEMPSPSSPTNLLLDQYGQSMQGKRKGYFNVLWDIVSPATKIVNTLIGNFMSYEYDINADPTDAYSKNLVEDEKLRLWVEKENMPFFKAMMEQVGLEYNKPEFLPETVEELELYEMSGGFKPNYARIMEQVIRHTLDISDWRDEVKKRLYRDLINLGVISVRDYYCEEEHKIKTRYVDPEYHVIEYSHNPDFNDSTFAGEFYEKTVSDLVAAGLDRDKLEGIAKDYSGYAGNPSLESWDINRTRVEAGMSWYDYYKICVFDCEWLDCEGKKELIHTNKFGKESVNDIEYDYKKKPTPNQKIRDTNTWYRYKCKWIVGTDIIFDYGKDEDITRQGKRPNLSFHTYKTNSKSITRQLIPLYDNFMILWLKYQNAISMAVNSGYAINVDALSNIKSGAGKNDKQEGVKRFLESGFFFYKETNPQGMRNTVMRPIEQLPGGIGQLFAEIIAAFDFNQRRIEDITGLNPVAMGATPNPNAPVGTTELSINAMTSTLRPLLSAYTKVKENMARNVCKWIQIGVRYNKQMQDAYISVFGDLDVQVLIEAEGDNVTYGIDLSARPTDVEKQQLYESAKISLASGRDGRVGIDESDFFAIVRIIESGGSLLFAETVLNNRIRKAKQEFQKSQQQMQEQNAKMQNDGIMLKDQAEEKAAVREHSFKLEEMDKEHTYRMEELRLQEGIRMAKDLAVQGEKQKNEQQKIPEMAT